MNDMSDVDGTFSDQEVRDAFRWWRDGLSHDDIRLSEAARTELAVAFVDGVLGGVAERFVVERMETDGELRALVDDLRQIRRAPIESILPERVESIVNALVPGRREDGTMARSLSPRCWAAAALLMGVGAILGFYGGHSLEQDRDLFDRKVMDAIWSAENPSSPWISESLGRGPV